MEVWLAKVCLDGGPNLLTFGSTNMVKENKAFISKEYGEELAEGYAELFKK